MTRARALIGTRFRLHGRDAEGIDCIGLIVATYGLCDVATGYALRTTDASPIFGALSDAGFAPVGELIPGDIVLFDAGPAQLHLGLWSGTGLIHADAGLRRVVETPGAPGWPVITIWRR